MLAVHIYIVVATCFILNKDCNLVKIKRACLKTKSHTALSLVLKHTQCKITLNLFYFLFFSLLMILPVVIQALGIQLILFLLSPLQQLLKGFQSNLLQPLRKRKARYDLENSAVFCAMYQLVALHTVHIVYLIFNLSFLKVETCWWKDCCSSNLILNLTKISLLQIRGFLQKSKVCTLQPIL